PCPTLDPAIRRALVDAALVLGREVAYRGLGTVEFLVDPAPGADPPFAFLEVNARLQVEHTVTEQVTGMDLVAAQIAVADGRSLEDLGLLAPDLRRPRGHAIQFRINAEVPQEDGGVRPAAGRIEGLHPASGPGIRVDAALADGFTPPPAFDSLLAKLVVHSPSPDYADCVRRARRALAEFRIGGIATNLPWLAALAAREEFAANAVDTRFLEDHAMALAAAAGAAAPAVPAAESGGHVLAAPMAGRLVQVDVAPGDRIARGAQVAVVEAMKMEHPVAAIAAGRIVAVPVAAGDTVAEGQVLAWLEPFADGQAEAGDAAPEDPDRIRPDLQRLLDRNAFLADESRPEAVARRHAKGMRTARENVADLCDPGSFVEYGALAIAAQRRRRPEADLVRETPADGLVAGIGTVNAAACGAERARCLVMAYDYTVLAGTQGFMNHKKTDRLLRLAEEWELPIVLLAEGGGGRPGDTDMAVVTGLDVPTFASYAKLSGRVPRVGVVAGHCFAGNAALLGCSDVIIATANASIGMGGPAMIEGGGLGTWRPEEVGPLDVQTKNGVVDIAVADEAAAIAAAKRYLSYFQGPLAGWQAGDARALRHLVPENRLRSYDVRAVIAALSDADSVLELRRDFGRAMVTALVRIEGRPMGLIANDSRVLSGAIDADAADKAARFLQLCDAFGLPVLSLCDTPGFMVGPDVETRAQVRHVSRMFVAGAALSVPVFCLVLRKGYGLGAMAMAGGGFHSPFFVAAWPTGEFGAMGLEGAVRLGFRRELSAIEDPAAREAKFRELVELAYAKGHGINVASYLEIDAVIDPAESRAWIRRGLNSLPAARPPRRGWIDAW
ncbi:MAG: hypothetical protein JNK22_06700, partial [Rhodocyclaceae bacterium]|nr:hypothetical protein [Rhodocyclaceae bacterium]